MKFQKRIVKKNDMIYLVVSPPNTHTHNPKNKKITLKNSIRMNKKKQTGIKIKW